MMKNVNLQLPAELLARVDEAAGDVPRNRWIRRAIEAQLGPATWEGHPVVTDERVPRGSVVVPEAAEQALSEAKEPIAWTQSDPGSVPSSEGVRSAAPAERPQNRADAFRQATQRELRTPEEGELYLAKLRATQRKGE